MDVRSTQQAAATLWSCWQRGERVSALPSSIRPTCLEEAYAIQRELDGLVGEPAGWKIAATSPAGQRHLGVSGPLFGRLYRPFEVASGAVLSVAAMGMRSAEPEFAFVMGQSLSPASAPFSSDAVASAVDEMRLTIEVPDSRFEDFAAAGGPQLVADAACGGYFVVGPTIGGWRDLDLPRQAVRMLCAGKEVSSGVGANVLGDPIEALTWLVNELAEQSVALQAGELAMTGASAPPVPVEAGDAIEADFAGLGRLDVRFVP